MNLTFSQCLDDPRLLGDDYQGESRRAWKCVARVLDGLPPRDQWDLDLFRSCTGRTVWPDRRPDEIYLGIGTRGGKTEFLSKYGQYYAAFKEHRLSPGERGYILCVGPTKRQTKILKNYMSAGFHRNDLLRPLLQNETREELELTNGVVVAVLASDYRSLRGFTGLMGAIDEMAYLNIEGSKPDVEIVRALRSRLISTGGPLIAISSPYAKTGELYKNYVKHWGKDGDPIFYWKAPSIVMNPNLDTKVIDRLREEDPEGSRADFDAEFRSDIESFVSRETVKALVVPGVREIPYIAGQRYRAFTDPAGGSGKDSFTMAIGHREGGEILLDCLRERKPKFSPGAVIEEFSETLKAYGVSSVTGDRYAGEFPRERFRAHGIRYELAAKPKSDLYRDMLPVLNSGEIALLDRRRMVDQIVNLERRTGRGGKDSIDHPPHGHDDLANSVAGLCSLLSKKGTRVISGAKIITRPGFGSGLPF